MNPSAWQFELSWPWCLAALLVLPLLVHYWRRSLVGVARWRQCASLGCRFLLVVLLVATFSGIEIRRPDERQVVAPVSTVPLEPDDSAEVYVGHIGAKHQVQRGEPFYVDVTIRSNHADEGTLELLRGQRTVARRQVQVVPGENRFRFARSIAAQAAERFTARISGFKDRLSENNEASCLVFATRKPRVLLVENELLLGRHLAEGLKDRDIDVVVRPPSALPKSLAELRGYELVILSNVPAAALPQERMEAMRSYVRDFGGGLIVIGGDHAFTPGGYRRTTLEEVLPVWCDPNPRKAKPSLAMVLVIDRSNSMIKGGALELAKEATRRAVAMLGPDDQLGVIAFEETSDWKSPGCDRPSVSMIMCFNGANVWLSAR